MSNKERSKKIIDALEKVGVESIDGYFVVKNSDEEMYIGSNTNIEKQIKHHMHKHLFLSDYIQKLVDSFNDSIDKTVELNETEIAVFMQMFFNIEDFEFEENEDDDKLYFSPGGTH